MKVDGFKVKNRPPIKIAEVNGLSNIVAIAGPNGAGKSRLHVSLLSALQDGGAGTDLQVTVSATCEEEKEAWGQEILNSANGVEGSKIKDLVKKRQSAKTWKSSVIYIDSERQEFTRNANLGRDFGVLSKNPLEDSIDPNYYQRPFRNRCHETVYEIVKRYLFSYSEIGKQYVEMQKKGEQLTEVYETPLKPYVEVFNQLLAPKQLCESPDANGLDLLYKFEGQELPSSSLSSGERQVLWLATDLLLREPEDCIILIDELEAHLHKDLCYRLFQVLQTIGKNNQFFFFTHSPDIISYCLNHSAIFLVSHKVNPNNQAQLISIANQPEESVSNLRQLGQEIGVISLGRRILLIEGTRSSIDYYVYTSILRSIAPDVVVLPSQSKQDILKAVEGASILTNDAFWGLEFFMVIDKDAIHTDQYIAKKEEKCANLRFLKRYSIENYFLDEATISEVFKDLKEESPDLTVPSNIRESLKKLTLDNISSFVERSVVAKVEDACRVDISAIFRDGEVNEASLLQISSDLSNLLKKEEIQNLGNSFKDKLKESIQNDDEEWKSLCHGKSILPRLVGAGPVKYKNFQKLYVDKAKEKNFEQFQDIVNIFNIWFNSGTSSHDIN